MKHLITILLALSMVKTFSQNAVEQFEKCYNEFKSAKTLFINGSFKGYGKNDGKVVKTEGTIALQKDGLNISKYKSFAISEVALLEKINIEEVIYNGINVYYFNQDKGEFENKGSWESSGKNYTGYSKVLLFGNLSFNFEEFEKSKNDIRLEVNNDGYVLRLPSTEDRGQVLMYFDVDNWLPRKIIRYNEKSNEVDYVVLTLTNLRSNITFPLNLFEIRNSSYADGSSVTSVQDLSNQKSNSSNQKSNPSLLLIGTRAPEWELLNSNGVKRKLSDYSGKVVILDFWATWCSPCVQAQPMLQSIQEKYKDVVVLGMDYNDTKGLDLNGYKVKKKIGYEMILNAEKTSDLYHVKALPTAYVIDRLGYIVYSSTGYSEKEEHQMILAIESALELK